MARSVDFSLASPAAVAEIHRAFSDEEYWHARMKTFGGMGRLDSLDIADDGTATVTIVHDLHPEGLPKVFAGFFPRRWGVAQTEVWRPVDDGRVRGEIGIATHGAPGSGNGVALLIPTETGSVMTCTATIEFAVPLIGGKIEALIARLMVPQFSVIQRFTMGWISENP